MEEKQKHSGLLHEMRPHAAWRAVEWTSEKMIEKMAEAGLIASLIGFAARLRNHLDVVTVVAGFAISLLVLLWNGRRRVVPEPQVVESQIEPGIRSQSHGIIGDLTNIRFEKARFGSDEINAEALDSLNAELVNASNYTSNGAASIGIGDHLTGGRDVHRNVQKFLRFTLSADIHGGKALTIRPRERLLAGPPPSPIVVRAEHQLSDSEFSMQLASAQGIPKASRARG
jgi:hypothetical protein